MNANDALEKLKQGNRLFMDEIKSDSELRTKISRDAMGGEQKPFAIILGCSDSRVPAELVFSQGLGDLFVIRVAGNIVAPSQIGSIEFACQQFGTELVVVMGHSRCGAITATVDSLLSDPDSLSPNLAAIVDRVTPAVHPIVSENKELDRAELLRRAGKANVLQSVRGLKMRSRILRGLASQDKLTIVGAEYCIDSGEVEFFEG